MVSDFDRALYVWKRIPDKSGAAPDYIFHTPNQMFNISLSGGKLLVLGEGHLIAWNTLPSAGAYPDMEMTGNIGNVEILRLTGISWDGTRLIASSKDLNKVYIWNGFPTSADSPAVTLDIGQPGHVYSNGTHLVVTQTFMHRVNVFNLSALTNPAMEFLGFNLPGSAVITTSGQLFVANQGGNKVHLWNDFQAGAGEPADVILGESDITDVRPEIGQNKVFWPTFIHHDGSYLWVGEFKFSGRLLRFSPSP